jgi:hypothetical protein
VEQTTWGNSPRAQFTHLAGSPSPGSRSAGLGCFASNSFVAATAIANPDLGQLAIAPDAIEYGTAKSLGTRLDGCRRRLTGFCLTGSQARAMKGVEMCQSCQTGQFVIMSVRRSEVEWDGICLDGGSLAHI